MVGAPSLWAAMQSGVEHISRTDLPDGAQGSRCFPRPLQAHQRETFRRCAAYLEGPFRSRRGAPGHLRQDLATGRPLRGGGFRARSPGWWPWPATTLWTCCASRRPLSEGDRGGAGCVADASQSPEQATVFEAGERGAHRGLPRYARTGPGRRPYAAPISTAVSYEDLAARHSVPLNTMRTWLRRSLIKLRECLSL